MFTFAGDFALASLHPCLGLIAKEFNVSTNQTVLVDALMILFLGLGCLVWNPTAMKIGKRPTLIISNGVFLAGLVWNANCTSWTTLLSSRILQGFGAGGAQGLAPGSISDVSFLHERATKLGLFEYNLLYSADK